MHGSRSRSKLSGYVITARVLRCPNLLTCACQMKLTSQREGHKIAHSRRAHLREVALNARDTVRANQDAEATRQADAMSDLLKNMSIQSVKDAEAAAAVFKEREKKLWEVSTPTVFRLSFSLSLDPPRAVKITGTGLMYRTLTLPSPAPKLSLLNEPPSKPKPRPKQPKQPDWPPKLKPRPKRKQQQQPRNAKPKRNVKQPLIVRASSKKNCRSKKRPKRPNGPPRVPGGVRMNGKSGSRCRGI